MNQVTFAPSFLSDKVKMDYADHKTALVREFLQNSVDAGASKVEFQFDAENRTLTVTDNGCGMNPAIMENALFKIGGTHKNGPSVGGFGSAKMILYFQHESFEIETFKDGEGWYVDGQGSSYSEYVEIVPKMDHGTIAKIKFSDSWAHNTDYNGTVYDTYYNFEYDVKRFLTYCNVPADVYWNGELINQKAQGILVRELDWCNIYSRQEDGANHLHVRIKGIKMFETWMSNLNQFITVELTSESSLNILTTNRDSLKYQYQKELDAIIEELSVDKNSFANRKGQMVKYNGTTKSVFFAIVDTLKKMKKSLVTHLSIKQNQAYAIGDMDTYHQIAKEITHAESLENQELIACRLEEIKNSVSVTKDTIASFLEVAKTQANIRGFKSDDIIVEAKKELTAKTEHDFVIKFDKDMGTLPKNMDPQQGLSPKYQKLAKVYLYSIKYVLERVHNDMNFRIGWVLSDNTLGMFCQKDGERTFLINPEKMSISIDKRLSLKKIFRLACHEITHSLGHNYHDEQFMIRYDDLLEIEDSISNWIAFEKKALEEVL
jgi:hypothetical protein